MVKVSCESNIVLGTECHMGQDKFQIRVRIRVSVILQLWLYIRLLLLELINTTQNHIPNPDPCSQPTKSDS